MAFPPSRGRWRGDFHQLSTRFMTIICFARELSCNAAMGLFALNYAEGAAFIRPIIIYTNDMWMP